jgi:hypothetical protein
MIKYINDPMLKYIDTRYAGSEYVALEYIDTEYRCLEVSDVLV